MFYFNVPFYLSISFYWVAQNVHEQKDPRQLLKNLTSLFYVIWSHLDDELVLSRFCNTNKGVQLKKDFSAISWTKDCQSLYFLQFCHYLIDFIMEIWIARHIWEDCLRFVTCKVMVLPNLIITFFFSIFFLVTR